MHREDTPRGYTERIHREDTSRGYIEVMYSLMDAVDTRVGFK
ncbi:MAG: hypothetical protein SNG14_02990 [Rikenellaceae bacterium]